MTVETLMEHSVLARSSFYVYFQDRHEVLRALIATIAEEIVEFSEAWVAGAHGKENVEEALKDVARLYAEHGRVLRALADGATVDPELEAIHAELVRMLIAATKEGIAREQERGTSVVTDAHEVARALVLMTERLANETWGRAESPNVADGTLDALIHIWCWSIYGEPPAAPVGGARHVALQRDEPSVSPMPTRDRSDTSPTKDPGQRSSTRVPATVDDRDPPTRE